MRPHRGSVVNCFQKSYLWLLNTTWRFGEPMALRLWIAFKNLIFDYWTQPLSFGKPLTPCCELLSKILSLTIEHNWEAHSRTVVYVVNCFQKSYLWLLNTTYPDISQLASRCELLSKILSLTIEHNVCVCHWLSDKVVNCFQKSYLWLLNTTAPCYDSHRAQLWIAFKNLIFDYWTQHSLEIDLMDASCELLSKILSLTIEHNPARKRKLGELVVNCFQKSYLWLLNTTQAYHQHRSKIVVNCFQKSYLWLLNTTGGVEGLCGAGLWIAFKNLIFDYWTQPAVFLEVLCTSCELLSKILSLTIEHN